MVLEMSTETFAGSRSSKSVSSASGTPVAAVMITGGASICGGLMQAAVMTGASGWTTEVSGDKKPHQVLTPQVPSQMRQLWYLACCWHPSKLLPHEVHSRWVHPSTLHTQRFCRRFFSHLIGSPKLSDR